jgi:hypothetical protein
MDKDWPIYAAVLFAVVFFVAIRIKSSRFLKDKTLEDYKDKNPECCQHGQVKCRYCGGTQLSLMRDTDVMGYCHRHLCSQCGKELYRSKLG